MCILFSVKHLQNILRSFTLFVNLNKKGNNQNRLTQNADFLD